MRTGTGTVDTDGYFDLKAGQSAQFSNMLTYGDGAAQYIVEEVCILLPEKPTQLHRQVCWN